MKKLFTLLLLIVCFYSHSQIFTGTGGSILNNGGQETYFNLNISGLANADSVFGLVAVTVDITHPAVEELEVSLISPNGFSVALSGVVSCSGSNFSNTTFQNGAAPITSTVAPYTGTFAPIGNLGRFNTGLSPNGTWKLYVKDFIAGANTGTLNSWSLQFGTSPVKPVILSSSNLPIVFLNTPNNTPLSDNDLVVNFAIVDNGTSRNNVTDPRNGYNGKASCHLRGSSSMMFEKKNIKVELRDNSGALANVVSLLGMPAESDWILTSGYSDKTLLRNALTHNIFQQMGHYAPRFRFVELVLNGEYFGVYMLMEQVKRGKDRVNIKKITPVDNQFPYITGGYILQINRTDNPGYTSLMPGVSTNSATFYYQYNYPKSTEITSQQMAYIKAYTDSFETAVQAPNFADVNNGYRKYIEDGSFIDYFILTEMCKNPDGYRLSTYLYKDNALDGGKLHIGPTWDYDISWHNCNYGNAFDPQFWQYLNPNNSYPAPIWWTQFMNDQKFKDDLYCRYHTLRLSTLSNSTLYQYIDGMAATLAEAQQRNFRQFPILGTYVYPNPQAQAGASYTSELADLKQWVVARAGWMDSNIPGFCANIGFEEKKSDKDVFDVFPNPFSNSFSVKYTVSKSSRVKVELYNLIGELIVSSNETKAPGEYTQEIAAEKIKTGTYILKMDIDGKQSHRKIIKL